MASIYEMTAEWVDADIAAGVLAASKREERIARRLHNWAITVYTAVDDKLDYYLCVGLHYGAATDNASTFVTSRHVNDSDLSIVPRHEIEADNVWACEQVAQLKAEFGDLPVRVNRPARARWGLDSLAS